MREIKVISKYAKKDIYEIVIIEIEKEFKTSKTRYVSGDQLKNLQSKGN